MSARERTHFTYELAPVEVLKEARALGELPLVELASPGAAMLRVKYAHGRAQHHGGIL
jgi:hypothetical protein